MQQTQLTELATTPVKKLIIKYFWPALIGTLAHTLYNIVDRIFIGQVIGADALSGVSTVFPIMIIAMAFGMLVGIGSSVQLSIALGQNKPKRAARVVGNAITLSVVLSAVVTAIGFAIRHPMLRLFGATDTTIGYAIEYLNIILLGLVFNQVGFALNSIIRAEGNARIAMYSMLICAIVHIPLDALFIVKLKMGVTGAALSTVISTAVLSVWVVAHFRSRRCVVPLKLRYLALKRDITLPIMAIGLSPFLMQIASSVVQSVFNLSLIKHHGDIAVGAMGIINSATILIATSVIALNMATQPIFGFNYGARNFTRVKNSLRFDIIVATAICCAGWVLVQLFPEAIIRAFNSEPEMIEVGVSGLRLFTLALPLVGFQIITGSYFQSVNKPQISIFTTLLRQVIVLLPILVMLPRVLGLTGIWLSMPIADTIAAGVCLLVLRREWRWLNSNI